MADPTAETAAPHQPRLADIDLISDELGGDGFPHEVFTTLRREAPVWWQQFPEDYEENADDGFWVLSKYEDVQAANRDAELFTAIDGPSLADAPELRGTMLVSMDGRDHMRQRKLISAGFTPRMISRLEEQARVWAAKIIDDALEHGTCDFVADVAYQLPMHMIADIVGIPVEDRSYLFQVTNNFIQGGAPGKRLSRDEQMALQVEMFEYAQELGRRKRANPQDDVWTLLATAEIETEEGERSAMGDVELDMFFMLLTLAGSETTRDAISFGLLALMENPEQLEILRSQPHVPRAAVDEIVRWASPVGYFARRATRDTEIRGVPIAEGQRITLWYPSANRDEGVFQDPFRFDVRRSPNEHLGFGGGGPHFCLGANLARCEITVLFEELLARTRDIELLGKPEYTALGIFNPVYFSLQHLPVRLA
jgi:cholest-4-en-3-one 26-monooxygenase